MSHPDKPYRSEEISPYAHRMLLGFRLTPILRRTSSFALEHVLRRFCIWVHIAILHIAVLVRLKRRASPLETWVNIFAETRRQSWTFLDTTGGTKKLTFRSWANFGAFASSQVVLIPCEAFWRFGEPVWCSLKRVSQPRATADGRSADFTKKPFCPAV